jgi:hypothetical protein
MAVQNKKAPTDVDVKGIVDFTLGGRFVWAELHGI